MSKVLTFSRTFPAKHPRKGLPTYFVEQILNELNVAYRNIDYLKDLYILNAKNLANGKLTFADIESFYLSLRESITTDKLHTIRGNEPNKFKGNRFKVSDKISPRVWFGKPYNSPQIIFWNDIEVKKTFDFKIVLDDPACIVLINNFPFWKCYENYQIHNEQMVLLAKNDGLEIEDFGDWFNNFYKPFKGQIICWSDNVNY